MRPRILAALILFLAGCSLCPVHKKITYSGIMYIHAEGISPDNNEEFRGVFRVDGKKRIFEIYFQDTSGVPAGNISVEKGSIKEDNLPDYINKNIFRYWEYVFYYRDKRVVKGDIVMEYGSPEEISGEVLPGTVYLKTPEMTMEMDIVYADKTAGKN